MKTEDAEKCPGYLSGFGTTENLEVEEGAPEQVRDDLHDCGCEGGEGAGACFKVSSEVEPMV